MKKVDVLLGLQWGDEGKGKVVDVLTPRYDVVARFQGGPNAGHTLEFEGQKYVLRSIPSGIFQGDKINIIGNGVVLAPDLFMDEAKDLEKSGHELKNRLHISKKAHLIMPTHRLLDAAYEAAKGKNKVGTTGKGIGPAYADKINRTGHRVGELLEPEKLSEALSRDFAANKYIFDTLGINLPSKLEIYEELKRFKNTLAPYIADTTNMIWKALSENKKVLVEGAQGSLLDIDHGTYPYVTSSNTVAAGACSGLGLSPKDIGEVIGIVKAYTTRVGNGAFPTEDKGTQGDIMCEVGKEFGTTTGRRRRCGWFDAVGVKYASRLSGIDKFALMKLDVLDGFEKIKICKAYKLGEKIIDYFPVNLDEVEPVYEEMDGWESVKGVSKFEDLPKNAQIYIKKIEELTGVKVGFISTSPERTDTIIL